jgi:hypothetical protein
VAYAQRNAIKYDPLGYHAVSLKDAMMIATDCKFEFNPGDIVFLRTGMYHDERLDIY